MKKHIEWFIVTWVVSLAVVLLFAIINGEAISIADILGFGGLLLFSCLIAIPLFYVPLMWLYKKLTLPSLIVLRSLALLFVGNIPLYLLLIKQQKGGMNDSEALLFLIGYFTMAIVYGIVFRHKAYPASSGLHKKKTLVIGLCVVAALLVTVLIYFNYQYFLQDEKYGTVRKIGAMTMLRSVHTTTLLTSGRVLISGGILRAEGIEVNNKSTEFFDYKKRQFTWGPEMHKQRAGHSSTLLHGGNVLIAGGFDTTGFLADAELYIAAENKFELLSSPMAEKRAAHTATLLKNGKVLIVGGVNGGVKANATIDIYDPGTKTFTKSASLHQSRTGHTASLLADGKVLIVGGSANWRTDVLSSCELFDPAPNKITMTNPLNIPRNKHVAIVLNTNQVLIAAGSDDASEIGGRYNTCEMYNSSTQKFSMMSSKLQRKRFKITNAGELLSNGNSIIAGDGKFVEIFDSHQQKFFTAKGNVDAAWMYPAVTNLPNGEVLITGGYNSNMQPCNGAWIYSSK